jgi:ATP-dependent DNA ligase
VTPPVQPPLAPMLARLARELPPGRLYEPKWDGFRCLAFRDGDAVDLRSRNDRPLARYFPELVEALRALRDRQLVLDGELMVVRDGAADFDALLARLHPAASRVERLAAATPAVLVAFDLLAVGDDDLRGRPFRDRRRLLERALAAAPARVRLTPLTADVEEAARWLDLGGGVDGVVAKDPAGPYLAGERALVKVKRERTADCVVAGFRLFEDRTPSSLLLGLHAADGVLRHVGVAASFARARRAELLAVLAPRVRPLAGHPWERGFLVEGSAMGRMKGAAARWVPEMGLDWVPVEPELVCEVAYDHVDVDRFRHPARFRRWRPDRDARSCTLAQLAPAGRAPALLAAA